MTCVGVKTRRCEDDMCCVGVKMRKCVNMNLYSCKTDTLLQETLAQMLSGKTVNSNENDSHEGHEGSNRSKTTTDLALSQALTAMRMRIPRPPVVYALATEQNIVIRCI